MLSIVKNNKPLVVSKKSFDNFYKNHGWQMVKDLNNGKDACKDKSPKKEEIEDEWADVEEEEVRKPLSEMNRQELEEYAAELGVDLSGLSSNKQYREAIKAAM